MPKKVTIDTLSEDVLTLQKAILRLLNMLERSTATIEQLSEHIVMLQNQVDEIEEAVPMQPYGRVRRIQ